MPVYNIKYIREKISDRPDVQLQCADNLLDYLEKYCFPFEELWREKNIVLFLSKRNYVLGHYLVSLGSNTRTVIDEKMIIKSALDSLASGVIIIHNHPDGDCRPSINDINETKTLKERLDFFDIKLIDHIILGEKEYYSFTEELTKKIKGFKPKKKTGKHVRNIQPS